MQNRKLAPSRLIKISLALVLPLSLFGVDAGAEELRLISLRPCCIKTTNGAGVEKDRFVAGEPITFEFIPQDPWESPGYPSNKYIYTVGWAYHNDYLAE